MKLNDVKKIVKELDLEKRKHHLERRLRDEEEATKLVQEACKIYNCSLQPIFEKDKQIFKMTVESNLNKQEEADLCAKFISDVCNNYHVDFTPVLVVPTGKDADNIKPEDLDYNVHLLTTW